MLEDLSSIQCLKSQDQRHVAKKLPAEVGKCGNGKYATSTDDGDDVGYIECNVASQPSVESPHWLTGVANIPVSHVRVFYLMLRHVSPVELPQAQRDGSNAHRACAAGEE